MMVNMLRIIGLFLILFQFTGIPADAEIYQWRDAQGILHFSDTPPPEGLPESSARPEVDGLQSAPETSADDRIPAVDLPGGMLWNVRKGSADPSHLLGTIHSEDPRVLALRPAVTRAFDSADTFVMEVVMDTDAVVQMGAAMMISGDTDLEALLGSGYFARAADAMAAYGVPPPILKRMKPWVVMAMLSMPKPKTGQFLDMVLYKNAMAQAKRVHGLETVQEQLNVFEAMSLEDQVSLLKATIDQLDQLPRMFDRMIRAYVDDDLGEIARIASEYERNQDRSLVRRFMFRLNDQRNRRMVSRMAGYLESGNAFIAVGALHLTGDAGIISLLREQGFTVTPVP